MIEIVQGSVVHLINSSQIIHVAMLTETNGYTSVQFHLANRAEVFQYATRAEAEAVLDQIRLEIGEGGERLTRLAVAVKKAIAILEGPYDPNEQRETKARDVLRAAMEEAGR